MNVTVFGSGYVGLVTGVCLAEVGNDVVCIDVDQQKIDNLKKALFPYMNLGWTSWLKKINKQGE